MNNIIRYTLKGLGIILQAIGWSAVVIGLLIVIGFLISIATWWIGAILLILVGAYLLGVVAL